MSFPPTIAKRFGLKIWSQYEQSATDILAMANSLVELGLSKKHSMIEKCLVAGMLKSGLTEDVVKRIFSDLIIAGGDTVRLQEIMF